MRAITIFCAAAVLGSLACHNEPTSSDPSSAMSAGEVSSANYIRIDLGTLGGQTSEAWAINNAGQVVGHSQTASNTDLHAFVWYRGEMRDLGTLGGSYSLAFDINATGQIVGESRNPDGRFANAFLWENGVMRDLGNLGGPGSRATGINNLGHVVGWGNTAGGWTRAFLWRNGDLKRLDLTPFAQAFAINAGLIVGHHRNADHPSQAFVLNKRTGVVTGLGTLGGSGRSIAFDVNQEGKVVGSASTASGAGRAFLWQDGVMRDLGVSGGDGSAATGISSLGHIVGYSTARSGATTRAFVWVNGVITDLGPGMPEDINRAGWIVGRVPDSNGRMRATLWKPRSE